MAISKRSLTKGQIRKLGALRKSVGNKLADDVFAKWMKQQSTGGEVAASDPVAAKLAKALAPLVRDKSVKLGSKGYVVKRSKGRGSKGFSIQPLGKPAKATGKKRVVRRRKRRAKKS